MVHSKNIVSNSQFSGVLCKCSIRILGSYAGLAARYALDTSSLSHSFQSHTTLFRTSSMHLILAMCILAICILAI